MVARGLITALATVDAISLHSEGDATTNHDALLQTWDAELDSASNTGKDTPVSRVVKLLENMQGQLQKEMKQDEDQFSQLSCWCNDGKYEKTAEIAAAKEKIEELQHNIESFTAKSAQLKSKIAGLESDVASDKTALAQATKLREKQLQAFHGVETDNIQAIENLKAALVILGRHHSAAFISQLKQDVSFVQLNKEPFSLHARSLEHAMDNYILENAESGPTTPTNGFLRPESSGSTGDDIEVVRKALKLVQTTHTQGYYPSYSAQSGQIVGILKQLKEQMEATLSEEQQTERMRAGAFEELRTAKVAEIEEAEKLAEAKEDQKARTDNELAEAKEDLAAENGALSETERFLMNLEENCASGAANFDKRKAARLEEIKAVSETIAILQSDDARDAMSGTFNSFVQIGSSHGAGRKVAATILRRAAAKMGSPSLSALATTVELDAFTKVKKAIDGMVAQLKVEQADEVKKTDWCKDSLQENEMSIAKTETSKDDLVAKIDLLDSNIVTYSKEVAAAKANIVELQTNLQRASEDRKAENLEFQNTISDQTVTIAVLRKAVNRLSKFYDQEFLLQTKQTPPGPEMEYSKNSGGHSAMSLLEKLIQDARNLIVNSRSSEGEAQTAYESMVADTNANVKALTNEVIGKTKAKAKTSKAHSGAQSDLTDTVDELEGLHGEGNSLHTQCDYLLKNFDLRQTARAQEIEALQQAKSVLSGANLS